MKLSRKDLEERVEDAARPRWRRSRSAVAEGQALHQRFAELLDVVTELLVPARQRDEAGRAGHGEQVRRRAGVVRTSR